MDRYQSLLLSIKTNCKRPKYLSFASALNNSHFEKKNQRINEKTKTMVEHQVRQTETESKQLPSFNSRFLFAPFMLAETIDCRRSY